MRLKLHEIQKELKAPKGQKNSFGNYNYRSCEDILTAVKPILPEGVTISLSDEMVLVGERYYIKATAIIADATEALQACGYAREALTKKGMDEAQITGSASSYARKYALNGLFAIDDTKDHDSNEHKQESDARAKKQAQEDLKRADTIYAEQNAKLLDAKTGEQFKEDWAAGKEARAELKGLNMNLYNQLVQDMKTQAEKWRGE